MSKNVIREMLDDIHSMSRQPLFEQETPADVETSDSNDAIVSFTKDDEIVQEFVSKIHERLKSTPFSYNDMDYTKNQNKVQWNGTIAGGIKWTVVYSDTSKGLYIETVNRLVTLEDTKALNLLNVYFEGEWYGAVRDAMAKNDLEKN